MNTPDQVLNQIRVHQQRREKLVHVIGIRFDDPLSDLLERCSQQVEAVAGVRVSRHDVIRVLLEDKLLELSRACARVDTTADAE